LAQGKVGSAVDLFREQALRCPLPAAVELIGEKWAFLILRGAFNDLQHFEEFQAGLGIARNILSDRLAKMVAGGIFQAAPAQPCGFSTRCVDGGNFASFSAGRRGRATSSPPQFGHLPFSTVVTHVTQNVHSNEQMRASVDSGGRSLSQHSQFGRSCSISFSN